MDPLHNISPIENKFRSLLIVAGVVIAIICSVLSFKAISTESTDTNSFSSMETPALVNVDFVVKATSTIGHSVMAFTNP